MGKSFSNLSFEFSKIFQKNYYFSLRSKHVRCCFCMCSFFSHFSFEIYSTYLTMHCHKCLFTWIITQIKLELAWLLNKFSDEVVEQKTLTKNTFFPLFRALKLQLITGFPITVILL